MAFLDGPFEVNCPRKSVLNVIARKGYLVFTLLIAEQSKLDAALGSLYQPHVLFEAVKTGGFH